MVAPGMEAVDVLVCKEVVASGMREGVAPGTREVDARGAAYRTGDNSGYQSSLATGCGLIPVHSPLLRESYLVSFPPLTYMLKFSGFSDLTSCLWWNACAA